MTLSIIQEKVQIIEFCVILDNLFTKKLSIPALQRPACTRHQSYANSPALGHERRVWLHPQPALDIGPVLLKFR